MKTKKALSVIAAASVAMTTFAAFAVTASAEYVCDLSTFNTTVSYPSRTFYSDTVLTGTLNGNTNLVVANGATITLRDVTINGTNADECAYAGITLSGDGTLILEGTNYVRGFREDYPGIHVPEGNTLTIRGDGSLTATSNRYGAGIGGGQDIPCGNIVIEGGNINAIGTGYSAGIGAGSVYNADSNSCGNITISGGTVTATACTTPSAYPYDDGGGAAGIGGAPNGTCGNITINGGTVTANGGGAAPGIGGGAFGSCGNITITDDVTSVTAVKGDTFADFNAPSSIGAGAEGSVGTVTIGGETGAISTSPYTYAPVKQATVTGEVTDIKANHDGEDNGATAFITTLTQHGAGDVTVNSVKWDITSNGTTKSCTLTDGDDLPTLTFTGDNSTAMIVLAVNNLDDEAATAVVAVD